MMSNYSIPPNYRPPEIMTDRVVPTNKNIFQQNISHNFAQPLISNNVGMGPKGFLPSLNQNSNFTPKSIKSMSDLEQKINKQNDLLEKLMNKMNNNLSDNNNYQNKIEQGLEEMKYKVMMKQLESKMLENSNRETEKKKKRKKSKKKKDIQSLVLDIIANDLSKKKKRNDSSSEDSSDSSSKSSPLLRETTKKTSNQPIIILPDRNNEISYGYPNYPPQTDFSPRPSYVNQPNYGGKHHHFVSKTYNNLDDVVYDPNFFAPERGYSERRQFEPNANSLDPRMIRSQKYQPVYSQQIPPPRKIEDPYGYHERISIHSNPDHHVEDYYSTPRRMNSHNVSFNRSPGNTDTSLNHSIENDYMGKSTNMNDEIIEVSDEDLTSPIVKARTRKPTKKPTITRNIGGKSLKSLRSLKKADDTETVFDFDEESIMKNQPSDKRKKDKRKVSWKKPTTLNLKSLCWAMVYPKLLMKDAKKIVIRKRHQTIREIPKKLDAAFEV